MEPFILTGAAVTGDHFSSLWPSAEAVGILTARFMWTYELSSKIVAKQLGKDSFYKELFCSSHHAGAKLLIFQDFLYVEKVRSPKNEVAVLHLAHYHLSLNLIIICMLPSQLHDAIGGAEARVRTRELCQFFCIP